MFGFFPVDVGFGGVSPDRASLTASKAFCSSCLRRILTCRFTRCLTSPWNLLRLAAFFRCCSFSSSSTRNAEAWERWKQISLGFCYAVASEQFVSLYPLFPHLERPGRQAAPRANFMFCFKICGVTAWTISTGLLWAGLSLTSDTEHAHLCLGLSATHREGKKKEAHGAAPSSCSMKGCSNIQSLDPKGTGQPLILLTFCKAGSTSGKHRAQHCSGMSSPSEVKD